MEIFRRGRFVNSSVFLCTNGILNNIIGNEIEQVRNYAARRGTRMKADKKKVKVEIKKVGFIPHNLRTTDKDKSMILKRDMEHTRGVSTDNVWISRFYRWRVYSFAEAIECHRETHHPTIFNQPNAKVEAFIELDMRTAKPTKFVEKFTRTAMMPYGFKHGEEKAILVFCKPEDKEAAEDAGATLVGGTEIIRDIEKGRIVLPDFDYVLAHPNIIPDMIGIRGILRKRFPTLKNGTLGPDIGNLVTRFRNGVNYTAFQHPKERDYGWVDVAIGTLDMEIKALEENFQELVNDILSQAPSNVEHPFVYRTVLKSAPSVERFKIDMTSYLPQIEVNSDLDSDDEDESDPNKKAKAVG